MQKTVLTANDNLSLSIVNVIKRLIWTLPRTKNLTFELFKKDFFAVYKKSILGLAWLALSPIIGIASWVFMSASGILSPGEVGIPYPAYVLFSTTLWGMFTGFMVAAASSLESGRGFVDQVNFPHEVLFFKQVSGFLATFIISFLLSMLVLSIFKVWPSWYILIFPLLVAPLLLLGGGIGLIVCVMSAVALDIRRVMTVMAGLLMFLTPVVYAPKGHSELLTTIIRLNPLSILITYPRDLMLFGEASGGVQFLITTLCSLFIFLIGWRVFFLTEGRVIERLY